MVASHSISDRAHVLAIQRVGDQNVTHIVVNLYAPNPNTNAKIDFYEELWEKIMNYEEQYNCTNTIVAGDFNLIFEDHEGKNRVFSSQEKNVSRCVGNLIENIGLKDIWKLRKGFTWRRPNSSIFSTIDRILFSETHNSLKTLNVNWSLSFSDHAAVEVLLTPVGIPLHRKSRITRLDPSLAKHPDTKNKVLEGFNEIMGTMPSHWDPHMKLEFAKVAIRTVCESVQAERKVKEKSEEESLNEELDMAISKLSKGTNPGDNIGRLLDYIEELRSKKQELINVQGERLAAKLGTKWYNEGEKSNRYFMRILNRATPDSFKEIRGSDGELTNDPGMIESEIVSFYKKLYEDYDCVIEDDPTFFDKLTPVSEDAENSIVKDITVDELWKTLGTCTDSAPGPDGIPYSILALTWTTLGPLIADAWRQSLQSGILPPSHKLSYLRLIPKAGKDLTLLTNWRPITLSNCDHKLITKTYARRMCDAVANRIGERQTAYLQGRLINDNVRAMLATINLTNLENAAEGLIVAFDAKKAFDSVAHSYIETCLKKFGCGKFVEIFKCLYKDLETDILVNQRIAKGFKILRGVKQGDALSCIIFIMCIEPLLLNIESNPDIAPINSVTLNSNLPKVYAYADDVNGTILDSEDGLRAMFREYERLTKISGLELNGDKTELIRLGHQPIVREYNVVYLGRHLTIKSRASAKINGVVLQRNTEQMVTDNVDAVCNKMDKNFRRWSRRGLSTLGKILIAKTFGISQIMYLMQCLALENVHIKVLNRLIYKFVWNRRYLAAKAPERVKREITNTSIKNGGLGMLDVASLDESLKIKSLGRLLVSNHPFMTLLRNHVRLNNFFYPSCDVSIDTVVSKGVAALARHRESIWETTEARSNVKIVGAIRSVKLTELVNNQGRQSIIYFHLWMQGKRTVSDLTEAQVNSLARYIDGKKLTAVLNAVRLNIRVNEPIGCCILIKDKLCSLDKCSAKSIRDSLYNSSPITSYKIGMELSVSEAKTWGLRLSKLTSVKHRNIILRVAHGDIYTKDKLYRFNLADSNECPRCGQVEDLKHKFFECDYAKRIWQTLFRKTNSGTSLNQNGIDPIKAGMGGHIESNEVLMTVNAEILLRLLYLKDDQNYLVHPKVIVEQCLRLVGDRDRNKKVKTLMCNLFSNAQA